jgi:type IV pilus assembly protein PilA
MLARIRKAEENDKGFTLIELLVVVIIIGILSAIAIPTFLKQREKAWDKAVKSDLRNNALKMEEARDDDANGAYPTVASTAADTTAGTYCIQVTSTKLPTANAGKTQHFRGTDGRPSDGAC